MERVASRRSGHRMTEINIPRSWHQNIVDFRRERHSIRRTQRGTRAVRTLEPTKRSETSLLLEIQGSTLGLGTERTASWETQENICHFHQPYHQFTTTRQTTSQAVQATVLPCRHHFEPSPPHNSQRIDANTDATNNTTKTTHTNTYYHILTHTNTNHHIPPHTNTIKHHQTQHSFPAHIQAYFIPSSTRLAQLYQDSCFVHDTNMFAKQGMSQSTGTLTLRQFRAVCAQRARLDEWSLSLLLREKRREDKSGREKRREKEREKKRKRTKKRTKEERRERTRRKKEREKGRETEREEKTRRPPHTQTHFLFLHPRV